METKKWKVFRETGLLLFVNQFLHIFGWSIILKYDKDNNVSSVYPERTSHRGFSEESTERAYERVTKYMKKNSNDLYNEVIPDDACELGSDPFPVGKGVSFDEAVAVAIKHNQKIIDARES